MSPTEAMNVAAVCTLTPGTVIQPQHLRPVQRLARDLGVEPSDLAVEEVDLAQAAVERQPFVERQLQPGQPTSTGLAKQMQDRWTVTPVAPEHAMNLILRPRPGPHNALAAAGQSPQHPTALIGRPHLGKQPGDQQPRERAGIEPIGLGLSLGDRAQLARVGHHDAHTMALQDRHDPIAARRRFQRNHVVRRQAVGEHLQRLNSRRDTPGRADHAFHSDRDLAEVAMHIQSESAHGPPFVDLERERGGTHDKDGFVLSAHRDKSQGRPRTTPSSQLIG